MQIFQRKFAIETGVDNRLLRFSVGIEDAEDIIDDLAQAFAKAKKEVVYSMTNNYTFQTNLLHNKHKIDPATGR